MAVVWWGLGVEAPSGAPRNLRNAFEGDARLMEPPAERSVQPEASSSTASPPGASTPGATTTPATTLTFSDAANSTLTIFYLIVALQSRDPSSLAPRAPSPEPSL